MIQHTYPWKHTCISNTKVIITTCKMNRIQNYNSLELASAIKEYNFILPKHSLQCSNTGDVVMYMQTVSDQEEGRKVNFHLGGINVVKR